MRCVLDCGCVIVNSHRHFCPSCENPRTSDPQPKKKEGYDSDELQAQEFNHLQELQRAYLLLPPKTDSVFSERRAQYEYALDRFIIALRDNGRIL